MTALRVALVLVLATMMGVPIAASPAAAEGVGAACAGCGARVDSSGSCNHSPQCRYYTPPPGATGPGSRDPIGDATLQGAHDLGRAIGTWLVGGGADQSAAARQEAARLRQHQVEAAAAAQAEAEEHARRRDEIARRLEGLLKGAEGGLRLKGFDGEKGGGLRLKGTDEPKKNDGLRPKGTPAFGRGGDSGEARPPGEPPSDPMAVDLRNLRSAAFLAQQADAATPEDADVYIDEAVNAANGDRTLLRDPPANAPAVSEKGLLAFQQANAEYRRARDGRLRAAEAFAEAERRRASIAERVAAARADLEKARAALAAAETLAEKERRMAEVFAAVRAEHDAWLRAKAESDAAASNEAFQRAVVRRAVRFAAVPDPVGRAEVLAEERRRLEPGLAERAKHVASRAYAHEAAQRLDADIARAYPFVHDPAREAELNRILARVRALSPYPDEPQTLRILGAPADPATEQGMERVVFSTSAGVYVGQAYLDRIPRPSPDEITFVIAHEIAHMHHDHSSEWDLASWDLEKAKDVVAPAQDPVARRARLRDYKQAEELDADRAGAYMALAAGAKPSGIAQAFAWIRGMEAERDARPSTPADPNTPAARRLDELTREHPDAGARFDALRRIYGSALGTLPPT